MSGPDGNRRWRYGGILALLFLAGVINYIDRQTLSVLKPMVKSALSTDDAGYAFLVNVFTFCYAGAYIVTGWLIDRIGVRLGLTIFVIVWSLATLGCGFAESFTAFAIMRALLGLAEPGSQPATIRALTLWVPTARRGLMMSLVGAGGTVGSVIAAPLVAWLAEAHGWQVAFIVPGVIGVGFGMVWWWVYRDPVSGGAAAAPQVAGIPAAATLPWRRLWTQRSLWGIVLARFVSDPVWYFCLFWMPGYFQEKRGLSLAETGRVAWIPFLCASVGAVSLAAISDLLARRWGNAFRARRAVLGALALFGPITMVVPHVPGLTGTVAVLCVVAVVCLAWLSILGPLVADTFPAGNVASVWSMAGAAGAIGAILFNQQVGRISTILGTTHMFLILGTLHLGAAVLIFLLVRPIRPLSIS